MTSNPRRSEMSAREAYNTVSDTVVGPNIRWRDNHFQAIAIIIFTGLGVLAGSLMAGPVARSLGMLLGAIAGLILGTFLSGLALMIYRGVRHARGRHD